MRRQPDRAALEAGRLLNRYSYGGLELREELTTKLGIHARRDVEANPIGSSAEAHAELLKRAQADYPELATQLLGQCAAGENEGASRTARTLAALEEGARTTASSGKGKKKPD